MTPINLFSENFLGGFAQNWVKLGLFVFDLSDCINKLSVLHNFISQVLKPGRST